MGTLLEHRRGSGTFRVYLSGDTLTGGHVDEIAARYPEIDLAVTHLGGTRVLLHTVTMDAEQGVDFLGRLGPAALVPVHYDDYPVFRSPLSAFEQLAHAEGLGHLVRQVQRGQTIDLSSGGPVP